MYDFDANLSVVDRHASLALLLCCVYRMLGDLFHVIQTKGYFPCILIYLLVDLSFGSVVLFITGITVPCICFYIAAELCKYPEVMGIGARKLPQS